MGEKRNGRKRLIRLNEREKQAFGEILQDYMNHDKVREMDRFTQHRGISTYRHCENVAKLSYWLNHRLKLGADDRSMLVGALLHDFHLYDWHKNGTGGFRHGFVHPGIAEENAVKYFQVDDKTRNIIRSHMFPLTLLHVPENREALIVSVSDKIATVYEVLSKSKKNRKAGKA